MERSAVLGAAKARRPARSGVPEAVLRHLGLRPSGVVHLDAHQSVMYAWGASDDARPDAMADVYPVLRRRLLDVDAGRLVDPALDVPALGGCPLELVALLPDGPVRNKPGAHLSAA